MSTILDCQIKWHGVELSSVLADIKRSIELHPRGRQTHPPRYAKCLWSRLRGELVAPTDHVNAGHNHVVRQIHDFYGWKAKHGVARRGVCAGALYRSAGYMALHPERRDGSKGPNRTVHIEHSVPAAVLVRALVHYLPSFATLADLHDFLIRHSVCAALSHEEEILLDQAHVDRSRNPAFDEEGRVVGPHPFLRYQPLVEQHPEFRLFNVVSGQEIKFDQFDFADHVATLEEASRRIIQPGNSGTTIYSLSLFEP